MVSIETLELRILLTVNIEAELCDKQKCSRNDDPVVVAETPSY